MIQRIQTLWLFLASAAALASLKFATYSYPVSDIKPGDTNVAPAAREVYINGASTVFLIVITVAIAVASMILIFLYKDRPKQKWLTLLVLLASLGNIALYYRESRFYPSGSFNLTALIVFIIPVLLFLAFRGIWRDEKLVKSTDRLR